MTLHRFAFPTAIHFGAGAAAAVGPHLLEQGRRRPLVVNIGSVLGHLAAPSRSEDCASKFALRGLSDSLRAELSHERIDLLLVSASATETEFAARVLETDGRPPQRPLGHMSAERVASQVVRAIRRVAREVPEAEELVVAECTRLATVTGQDYAATGGGQVTTVRGEFEIVDVGARLDPCPHSAR